MGVIDMLALVDDGGVPFLLRLREGVDHALEIGKLLLARRVDLVDRLHVGRVKDDLAGVVSIRDILNARLKEADAERKELADYITGTPQA